MLIINLHFLDFYKADVYIHNLMCKICKIIEQLTEIDKIIMITNHALPNLLNLYITHPAAVDRMGFWTVFEKCDKNVLDIYLWSWSSF